MNIHGSSIGAHLHSAGLRPTRSFTGWVFLFFGIVAKILTGLDLFRIAHKAFEGIPMAPSLVRWAWIPCLIVGMLLIGRHVLVRRDLPAWDAYLYLKDESTLTYGLDLGQRWYERILRQAAVNGKIVVWACRTASNEHIYERIQREEFRTKTFRLEPGGAGGYIQKECQKSLLEHADYYDVWFSGNEIRSIWKKKSFVTRAAERWLDWIAKRAKRRWQRSAYD